MGISVAQVRCQAPYYIDCIDCGHRLEGMSPEDVLEAARYSGWQYDPDSDCCYCSVCAAETKGVNE